MKKSSYRQRDRFLSCLLACIMVVGLFVNSGSTVFANDEVANSPTQQQMPEEDEDSGTPSPTSLEAGDEIEVTINGETQYEVTSITFTPAEPAQGVEVKPPFSKVTLQKDQAYTVLVKFKYYEDKTLSQFTPSDEENTFNLNDKLSSDTPTAKKVKVTVEVQDGYNTPLTEAEVLYKGGSVLSDSSWTDREIDAGKYTFKASLDGFEPGVSGEQDITGDTTVTITLQPATPTIAPALIPEKAYMKDATKTLEVTNDISQYDYSYKWSIDSSDIASIQGSAEGNSIILQFTGKNNGGANVTVQLYHGTDPVVGKSHSVSIIAAQDLNLAVDETGKKTENGVDASAEKIFIDQTEQKFNINKIPDGLPEGTKLKVEATGNGITDGSYTKDFKTTDLTAKTFTVDFSGYLTGDCLQGTVTYKFSLDFTDVSDPDQSTWKEKYDGYSFTLTEDYYISQTVTANTSKLTDGEITLTYGDNPVPVKDYFLENGVAPTRNYTYSVKTGGEDIVGISGQNIEVKNAGTATIVVTRSRNENDFIAGDQIELPVTVGQKTIDLTKVRYTTEPRDYDGTDVFSVQGTIDVNEAGGLEKSDEGLLTVSGEVKLPSDANGAADTYSSQTDAIKFSDASKWSLQIPESLDSDKQAKAAQALKNYRLTDVSGIEFKPDVPVSFTINPQEITIRVSNKVMDYGDLDTAIRNAAGQEYIPEGISITCEQLIQGETTDYKDWGLSIIPLTLPTTGSRLWDVGEHERVLKVDIATANARIPNNERGQKNYTFSTIDAKHTWGTLTVTREAFTEAEKPYLSFTGDNNYVKDESARTAMSVWIPADKTLGILKAEVADSFKDRYNAVILKKKDGSIIDLTNDGISAEDLTAENLLQSDKLTVSLAHKEGTGYLSESSAFDITVQIDAIAPDVQGQNDWKQEEITTSGIADWLNKITFGYFEKTEYQVSFTAEDLAAQPQSGAQKIPGSGIQKIETYVWQLEEDEPNNPGAADIQSKIEGITWKEQQAGGDGVYAVTIPEDAAESGDYIIIIRATDNVNNVRLFSSNGIVIEEIAPQVSIEIDETNSPNNNKAGTERIYNSQTGILYNIRVNDFPEGDDSQKLGVSGIAKVEWTVSCDGVVRQGTTSLNGADVAVTGSKEYAATPDFATMIASDVIPLRIPADLCESNDIDILVTVTDRAGNVSEAKVENLKLDVTQPTVNIEYDNNGPKNEKYFDSARTATVTFHDWNFSWDQVTFELQLEGESAVSLYTLEELKELAGIQVVTRNMDATQDYIATVTFAGDNRYQNFNASCVDLAEYESKDTTFTAGTVAEQDFVVDNQDPIVSVSYYYIDQSTGQRTVVNAGTAEAARAYVNHRLYAEITIKEHNFKTGTAYTQYAYSVTKPKNESAIADYTAYAQQDSSWILSGTDSWTMTAEFSEDANYVTSFAYTDLAGRNCGFGNQYFTVDMTKPTGTVTIRDFGVWEKFVEELTFGLFDNHTMHVSANYQDITSPIQSVRYYLAYSPATEKQLDELSEDNWQPYNGSVSIDANRQFIPYFRITDQAGNYMYMNPDRIAVVDNQNPYDVDDGRPIITITASRPAHDIYNANVPFTIAVEDPVAGNTYSGLRSVRYDILRDGSVTASRTYSYEPGERRIRMSSNEVVNAEQNNSNDVTIRVIAIDNAGNETTEEKDLKIDITEPSIQIAFNNNSPLNGQYYKDTRTATVTVTERNFDESAFVFTITNTDGTRPTISGWSHSADAGVSDSATHTCTVTFSSDGDYTMEAHCTDLAGNNSRSQTVPVFTIDKTLPEISVSYDNNEASEENYYKAVRTATITIHEHNFNASAAESRITAMLNGQPITAPTVSGWTARGDYHTATVSYTADGDYTFTIGFTDLAGNVAEAYPEESFTIDTVKPAIEFPSKQLYGEEAVAPVFRFTDINADTDRVEISLVNRRFPNQKMDLTQLIASGRITISEPDENGEITLTFNDFEHTKDMDGLYELSVVVTDKAGNVNEEATRTFTFSVNRFGAYYILSDETADYVNAFYNREEQDIVISEYNISQIADRDSRVYYTLDGETVDLAEGEGYTRTEQIASDIGGVYVYTYTANASNFAAEGMYDLVVESRDETGNSMTNKLNSYEELGSAEIEFIIDKTNPSVNISNLENGEAYTETQHTATAIATDNIGLAAVDIYIASESQMSGLAVEQIRDAGELMGHYDNAEDVAEEFRLANYNGEIPITINEANHRQVIVAVSTDLAGNEMFSEKYTVLVTSNRFVQFYNNTPLFVGSIAGLLVLIALVIILIAKRRRKS